MQIEIVAFISVCTAVLGAVFGFMGQSRAKAKDIEAGAAQQAVIVTKLDNISATLTDIKADQKATSNDIREISNRLTVVERDLKSAWNQIEELKEAK